MRPDVDEHTVAKLEAYIETTTNVDPDHLSVDGMIQTALGDWYDDLGQNSDTRAEYNSALRTRAPDP